MKSLFRCCVVSLGREDHFIDEIGYQLRFLDQRNLTLALFFVFGTYNQPTIKIPFGLSIFLKFML